MRSSARFRVKNTLYSSFLGIFLVLLIILVILDNVDKLSKKDTTRSKVLAKRKPLFNTHTQIPKVLPKLGNADEINLTVKPRGETAAFADDDSPSCQPLHFIPHAETRPVTALVSFPGSGNTWLRYLIQQSTGILTGSQFIDDTLMRSGFPGEPVFNASVAVVKTHQRGPQIRLRFQKAVLLVRHPKPAIQALFNLYSQGHTGCAPKEKYERNKGFHWSSFFNMNLKTWQLTNLDWIHSFKGPLHIVYYDQLRNDLGPTLRSLVQFLDLPLNETAIQCTVKHSEGLYHRKSCNNDFDPFTKTMQKQVANVEQYVFNELEKYISKNKPA